MRTRLVIVAIAVAGACGSSTKPAHPDAAIDAFASACGLPGDPGNELGIGKFCTALADCVGTPMAPLCSIVGDSTTHFCTKTCSSTGSASQCGTNTTCSCNTSNQCGCTPNTCL
jgi:hypothetical protein